MVVFVSAIKFLQIYLLAYVEDMTKDNELKGNFIWVTW